MRDPKLDSVKIKLSGRVLSGKTAVLHIIGQSLRDAGFNVEAIDDGNNITEFEPIPPVSPDNRIISIYTEIS